MIFSYNFGGRNITCRWDETSQKAYMSWYCPEKLSRFQEAEEMATVTSFTEYMSYITNIAEELNSIALLVKKAEELEVRNAKFAASPFANMLEVASA